MSCDNETHALPPPPRERLLFVAQEFTDGGAALLALNHMRRLAPRYAIDLLVTGPHDARMLARLPPETGVFLLEIGRLRHSMDAFGCLQLLLEHRAPPPFQRHYRAVLATSVLPDWRASLAFSLVQARRKLLFLVDEGLKRYAALDSRKRSAVDCGILAADRVLPVSGRLWQRMAALCPLLERRPWQVFHPPIEPAELRRRAGEPLPAWQPSAEPTVLTAARLCPDKQILLSLRVHHRLHQEGVRFRWIVLGTGPQQAALQEEIARLGMGDRFLLAGHQPDVPAWMKACDFFALLSASEGCPTVVLEALSIGCPVFTTDVNGVDEMVAPEITGLIVANDFDAIAAGLRRMLTDGDLRARFRRNLTERPPPADPAADTARLVACIEEPAPAAEPTDAPAVSILIPAYNHERWIDKAISSALMQDFPSLEVIVADDASTDRTALLARTWLRDPRFRHVRNEQNLGRVANYRKALTELARGEWVLVLDGDDFLIDPGFIRRAYEAIHAHPSRRIVFAQAGHRVHYPQGERPDVDILPPMSEAERLLPGAEYLRLVYDTNFFTHLGTLYNRKAAMALGFYTAPISSSDMDSLLRLALEGDVLVLNTVAGCWVQHGGNASSNLPLNQIAANVRIFRQIARMAAQRGLTSMSRIDGTLTRYEARILAHLFRQTIGKTAKGPLSALQMFGIALSVNPRLILNRSIVAFCQRQFRRLTRAAIQQKFRDLLARFRPGREKERAPGREG